MNIDIGNKRQVLIAGGGIGGLAAGVAEVRARYFGNRSEQQLHDGLAWLYSTRANEVFE